MAPLATRSLIIIAYVEFSIEKLREEGYLCRESTNECDLPEICNGISGQCPPDVHKKNGNPCDNNKGYCFSGICPTLDGQCRLIWGDGNSTFKPN